MPRKDRSHAYDFRASDTLRTIERQRRQQPEEQAGDPCARGEWCASGAKVRQEDGTVRRAPSLAHRAFCDKDWGLISRCLSELPDLHARLHKNIGTHIVREVTIRIPFGPSVPLRLDVDEIMRLIVDAVMTWHERVADIAGLSSARTSNWREDSLTMRSGDLLPHPVRVLGEHMTTLLGLEPVIMLRPSSSPAAKAVYGAEDISVTGETALVMAGGKCAGNEIMRLEWLGRAALLETPAQQERLTGVPCRNTGCERRALRRAAPPQHEGDLEYYSECLFCGDLLTPGEYSEWTAMVAAYQRNRPVLGATPAA